MNAAQVKFVRWLLPNALMFAALWIGLIHSVVGALNVALFMCWAAIISSLLFLSKPGKDLIKKNYPPAIPRWADLLFDFSIVLFWVWHAWWVTAAAYFVHAAILDRAWREVIAEIQAEAEGGSV